MKLSLVFIMLAAGLVLAGPDSELKGALTKSRAELPGWVIVPRNFDVTEIDYRKTAAPRSMRGKAVMSGDKLPASVLPEVEAAYAAKGYETLSGVISPADSEAKNGFLKVADTATGRSASFIVVSESGGSRIEVSFLEPSVRLHPGMH